MTSRLRRKRQTILRPVLTLASALAVSVTSLVGPASAGTEPRTLPALRPDSNRTSLQRLNAVREKTDAIIQAQATQPFNPNDGSLEALERRNLDEDYYFKIETNPPSREQLFTIGSEVFLLEGIVRDFKAKDPSQVFLLPAPIDRFNITDSPNLGSPWFQNRATGPRPMIREADGREVPAERAGVMGVKNGKAMFPVGGAPEVAIMNESVGAPNMFVTLDINLGNPTNQFGLVFRANDPNTWPQNVDQIKQNTFYFTLVTADTVMLGKSVEGVQTVLKPSASITPKASFNLAVTAFGDKITVLRDGEVILEATDNSLTGDYVGMYGAKATEQPIFVEQFYAARFGGPFEVRQFAQTVSAFHGPSVHYHPLYFRQLTLERYGHSMGNLVQPWIAAVAFYADFFALPYSIGKTPPWVCLSEEGYALPGDVVLPFRVQCPVWDTKGAALQTAVMVLAWSLIP